MNGNNVHIERHKQDSNPNPIIESESSGNQASEETDGQEPQGLKVRAKYGAKERTEPPKQVAYLPSVLEACLDISDYTTTPINNWGAFIEAQASAWGAGDFALGLR